MTATERGLAGNIPYAATGSGRTTVVCAGLWHTTGVDSAALVQGAIGPLADLGGERRLVVVNRRADLPDGVSIGDMAAEYAGMIRGHFGAPVDVVGTSTGGSIAQQLAADHPDTVRRLVLVSTACRLGTLGAASQARAAIALRAGRSRAAFAEIAGDLATRGLQSVARGAGWLAAPYVLKDAQQQADLAATLEAEDSFDLARCAHAIQARTLIVAGGRDRFYSRELFVETAALIPDSELRCCRDAGTSPSPPIAAHAR